MSAPPPPPPPVVPVPDPDTARTMFAAAVEQLDATLARIASFDDEQRHCGVNDEWSAVESMQHLVFVIDLWLSKSVQGHDDPFHPIGMPPHFVPRALPGSSIDPEASPTFDEARDVLRGRVGTFREYVDAVTQEELDRPNATHAETVAGALSVIFVEFTAHNHFINRDLDTIESS